MSVRKKLIKNFKNQEDKIRDKSMEQEKSLLTFSKFIALKSNIEKDYSNSLNGILTSLRHSNMNGMEQVENSLYNEVNQHNQSSTNLNTCAEDIQSLLLNHRTKSMMSMQHLSKQQQEINNLFKSCEILEKSFKRSKTQFESNLNTLQRKKTVLNKLKSKFKRESTSLSHQIVGESWKDRNEVEKTCSKYLITLTEAYTRLLLLNQVDLVAIDSNINDAFMSVLERYLKICVKNYNFKEDLVKESIIDKSSMETTLEDEILSKLDEIYNYYYTFCLKSQSNDLFEQLSAYSNNLSVEGMRLQDKMKSNASEQLKWREIEIQVSSTVLKIQKLLVLGEANPNEIMQSIQGHSYLFR
eukprot:NODE_171_length_14381_cov_0.662512.p3 type:complete len:355 gc:universal NODE_171_length_14381_cov_0.662512:8545-7481(-)